jgi:CRISPR-associated protein Cas2
MDERVIIAYDVTDDRRRYRFCKLLERYGERIQYSVFELYITQKELYKLVDDLHQLMDSKADRLLVMRLCGGCHTSIGRYGNTGQYEPSDTLII